MSNNANNYDPTLTPELGDFITVTTESGQDMGTIIYRDANLIRIDAGSALIDYPLVDGLFDPGLGITDIAINQKSTTPWFSQQCGIVVGSSIEFYSMDAEYNIVLAENAIVTQVFATEDRDAIELQDGRIIDFQFIGPPPPYIRIIAKLEDASRENDSAQPEPEQRVPEQDAAEAQAELDRLFELVTSTGREVIRETDRIYTDEEQRQSMYVSLIGDVSQKRQKDPRVIQRIYRITDQLLGLKNSIMDDARRPVSYTTSTVQEILGKYKGATIPAVLPVAAVKKQLYSDIRESNTNDIQTHVNIAGVAKTLVSMAIPQKTTHSFQRYIGEVLSLNPIIPAGEPESYVTTDYDVIRSVIPSVQTQPQGLQAVAGAIDKNRKPIDIDLYHWIGSGSTAGETTTRLLHENRVRGKENDVLVARADTADTVGHILLSPELSARRSKTRSSVLLWDMHASEASRKSYAFTHNDVKYNNKPTFYKDLVNVRAADQRVLTEDISIADVLQSRMAPILSITNAHTTELFDSFGLTNLEITQETMATIDDALTRGQANWQAAYAAMDRRIKESLNQPTGPAVPPSVSADSALFSDATLSIPALHSATIDMLAKESTLQKHDLTLTSDILKVAEGTLTDVWYDAASGRSDADAATTTNRERIYTLEAARKQRIRDVKRDLINEFQSTPDINTCPHVEAYGLLKGVKSDPVRMLLFKKFLQTYQGEQRGAYIQCIKCRKDLVCKHELLLLHEYMNRDRAEGLHKELLLEYGGPVFEGSYICKACGQPIRSLDYDTSLEYDSEGRPLIGRTVIQEDDDEGFLTLMIEKGDTAEPGMQSAQEDMECRSLLRVLFDTCGMVATPEMYERICTCMKNMPPPAFADINKYKTGRAKDMAKLSEEQIKRKHMQYMATQKICTLAAFVVLELQTSDIVIPFPAPGCAFGRGGFPLTDYIVNDVAPGALNYVACAAASLKYNESPWKDVEWSPELNADKRIIYAKAEIEPIVAGIMAKKRRFAPGPPIPNVTNVYKDIYAEYMKRTTVLTKELLSDLDRVPPSFRPLPVTELVSTQPAIQNVEAYMESVAATIDGGLVDADGKLSKDYVFTVKRQEELSREIIHTMHEVSKSTAHIDPTNTKSDTHCCPMKLADVRVKGFGASSVFGEVDNPHKRELEVVSKGYEQIRRRDPALSASGTHIYVPWSAPEIPVISPEPDEDVYYTLFMKHCEDDGNVHEFQRGVTSSSAFDLPADAEAEAEPDYVCRRCGLSYPASMDYLVPANIAETNPKKLAEKIQEMHERRKELALEALEVRGIVVNKATYDELDQKIRLSRALNQASREPDSDLNQFMNGLNALAAVVQAHFPAAAAAGGAAAATMMQWEKIHQAMIQTDVISDIRQRGRLTQPFFIDENTLLQDVARVLRDKVNYKESLEAFAAVPSKFVSFLQQTFVTPAYNVSSGSAIVGSEWTPAKWIDGITKSHKDDIYNAWNKYNGVTQRLIDELNGTDDETFKSDVRDAMQQFATWVGDWLHVWHTKIRIIPNEPIGDTYKSGFTLDEELYILRWVISTGLNKLFTATSPAVAKFAISWAARTIQHYTTYLSQYDMTEEEIKEALLKRTTMERRMFLKKFDDETDTELRRLALQRKKYKVGDEWTLDTRNQGPYRAEIMEHRRDQLLAMGIIGSNVNRDITAAPAVNMHEYAEYNHHADGAE